MLMPKMRRIAVTAVIFLIWMESQGLYGVNNLGAAEKTSLWKIQSKTNTVYLLGSIHYLRAENYPLNQTIEDAFKDSKNLVLEIDLGGADQKASQQVMITKAVYTNGKSLKESISEKTYGLAAQQAQGLGIDIQTLNSFKPWFVALAIATMKLQSLGFDPNYGVDRYFYQKAKEDSKAVTGLETVEYQINLFDGMPEKTQESLLEETIRDLDTAEADVSKVVNAWASGDIATLDTALLQTVRDYPEVYQKLILDRNRNWLPKIEGLLTQKENYLVVVGAGHLAGKDGVVEMLKAKGYAVVQL